MAGRSAILFDLDSLSQRELYTQTPNSVVDAPHALAGIIRAAVLYGDRLVITDSQLFDGSLLLALGPSGLGEILGYMHKTNAVSVSLRADTAADSLAQMRESASFEWQVEAMGWSQELIARKQRAWVHAIDEGMIAHSVRPPQPHFADNLRARLEQTVPTQTAAAARSLLGGIDVKLVTSRSEMRAVVAEAAGSEVERDEIRNWWDAAYMDIIAAQHGAYWISATSLGEKQDSAISAEAAPRSRADQLRITDEIPRLAIERLAELSGSEFAGLHAAIRPIQDRQRRQPSAYNRLRLRIAVLDGTKRDRPVWRLVQSLGRVAAWIGVLVLALVDTSGFAKWVIVAGTIAGIAVQIPVAELDTLRRSFSRETKAFIREPIGGRA